PPSCRYTAFDAPDVPLRWFVTLDHAWPRGLVTTVSLLDSVQGSRHGAGTADHRLYGEGRRRENERRSGDRGTLRAARIPDDRAVHRHRALARGLLRSAARLGAGANRAEPLGSGVRRVPQRSQVLGHDPELRVERL